MLCAGWSVYGRRLLRSDPQTIEGYARGYLLVGQSVTPNSSVIAAFIQKLSCGDAWRREG